MVQPQSACMTSSTCSARSSEKLEPLRRSTPLSFTLFSDNLAITTRHPASPCFSDGRVCRYHHVRQCKGTLDLLPVSRADGGSNLAITRGQYALAAQTEAGKAIVTIVTDLSRSANAYRMCSRSHH